MHKLQTTTVYLFFTVISFFLFLSVSQALDGRIYEHVKDYLVALCHNELEASQATHNTFQFLLDKSTRVSPMRPFIVFFQWDTLTFLIYPYALFYLIVFHSRGFLLTMVGCAVHFQHLNSGVI